MIESIYLSNFKIFSDMSLAATFLQEKKPPSISESGTIHNFKRQCEMNQGQFPIFMEDYLDLWNRIIPPYLRPLIGPSSILQKFPILTTLQVRTSLLKDLCPLDSVFKQTSSIFALSSLGCSIKLLSNPIAQDLLSLLFEHSLPPVLSFLLFLP